MKGSVGETKTEPVGGEADATPRDTIPRLHPIGKNLEAGEMIKNTKGTIRNRQKLGTINQTQSKKGSR